MGTTWPGRRDGEEIAAAADVTVLAPFVSLMVSIARLRDPAEDARADATPPRPPRTEVTFHAGGQGYWIANMAAELGAATRICCPIGGRSGQLVRALLADEMAHVVGTPAHRSNSVWISEGPDGEPATVAETPPPPLDRHEVDDLCNEMLAWGLRGGVAALAGVPAPGMVEADVYARLTADLIANGVRVVADVSPELVREVARAGASVVKISHEELIRGGLAADASEAALLAAGRELRAAGAGAVLISRAERPALAIAPPGVARLRPPRLVPVNARGAGDAMTGALAAGLALGRDLGDALRLAAAAGTLNVSRRGLGTGLRDAIEVLARSVALEPIAGDRDGLPRSEDG